MCDGNYRKNPHFVAQNRERYRRDKASYRLRGTYRRISGKACIYCGAEKETGDHVPSLFAGYTNGVVAGVVVPVCKSCNTELGPFASTCFDDRLALLEEVYLEKATKNQMYADHPKTKNLKWRDKAEMFRKKAGNCADRKGSDKCSMLDW
jgi:hypothetical protein